MLLFHLSLLVQLIIIYNDLTMHMRKIQEHLMHDIFIYGYEDGYFYTCDYFDFSKKSTRKITSNDIENGYKNVSKPNDYGRGVVLFHNEGINDNIVLYQYKESLNGLLDIEKKGILWTVILSK